MGSPVYRYHPDGIHLVPGLIEQITPQSSAYGERHFHLRFYRYRMALYAWQGGPEDPENEIVDRGFRIVGVFRAKLDQLEEAFVFTGRHTAQANCLAASNNA